MGAPFKCRNPGCKNDVLPRLQASGMVFCSRECSPLGGFGGVDNRRGPKPGAMTYHKSKLKRPIDHGI